MTLDIRSEAGSEGFCSIADTASEIVLGPRRVGEEEEEVECDEECVPFPLLDTNEFCQVMGIIGETETEARDVNKLRSRIGRLYLDVSKKIVSLGLADELLLEAYNRNDVEFAEGDSDAESIRDYDGDAKLPWWNRDPYLYR